VTRRRFLLFAALLLFLIAVFHFKDRWNEYRRIKTFELTRALSPALTGYLSHPNPHIRASAFQAVYRIGDERSAVDYWAAFLREKDPVVRQEALFGLRYFPSLHSRLKSLLEEAPPGEKALLCESFFFNSEAEEDVRFLISLLNRPGYPADTLYIALGNLGRKEGFSPALTSFVRKSLLEKLSSESSRAHAYALSQWKASPEEEVRLLALITGLDPWKEYYYISLLVSEKALQSLLDDFESFPPQIRIRYLQQAASHDALRGLLYPRCKSSLERLPLVVQENRPELLKEFLSTSPSFLREAAFRRLLKLQALSADEIQKYREDSDFLRAFSEDIEAASSLAGSDFLFSLTGHEDETIRRNVHAGLAKLYPEKTTELALQALEDPDFTVRLTGYDLLSGNEPLFKRTLLERYPREPDPQLRIFLAESLQAEQDRETLKILKETEKDERVLSIFKPLSTPPFLKYNNSDYLIRFNTEKGTVTIRCFGSQAPQTVENIVTLVKKGFYDGIPFHRVALNHVIQAGDPHGDGWGGSLPLIKSEISRLSYDEPGMVGIADRGKDTGSSQFFITLTPRYHLNSRYTIFARVIDGMDVVGKIEPGDLILSARVLNNMR